MSVVFPPLKLLIFVLSFQEYERPPNDSCESATTIDSLPKRFTDTNVGAFPEFVDPTCGIGPDSRGVWYTYVGDDSIIEATLTTSFTFQSEISVFRGSCARLECVQNVAASLYSYSSRTPNVITWLAVAGETYYILATGADNLSPSAGAMEVGSFRLDIVVSLKCMSHECGIPPSQATYFCSLFSGV